MATALTRDDEPLTNVSDMERVGSTIAGVALLVRGLSRGSLAGRGAAALGRGRSVVRDQPPHRDRRVPDAYATFNQKEDDAIKYVVRPN